MPQMTELLKYFPEMDDGDGTAVHSPDIHTAEHHQCGIRCQPVSERDQKGNGHRPGQTGQGSDQNAAGHPGHHNQ